MISTGSYSCTVISLVVLSAVGQSWKAKQGVHVKKVFQNIAVSNTQILTSNLVRSESLAWRKRILYEIYLSQHSPIEQFQGRFRSTDTNRPGRWLTLPVARKATRRIKNATSLSIHAEGSYFILW